MRRLIALLAGVLTVFSVAAAPVAAEPAASANGSPVSTAGSTPTNPIPKDAIGLSPAQVAGSGLAVTLDAGASEEHDLVVSNHTANLRLTVHLTATDATGNPGGAASSWLSFGDDAIQLDPHVATTVPMTIAVPHDTQPGSALAHVTATVESAVLAADGTPVAGSASDGFPVSIAVSGTPTAQIAIADVHRVDQGSQHQLAVVLRNFGQQSAAVSGHVRVAGDSPQTLPFQTELAASRDTTLDLDWKAPPVGTASDISVDLEYGGGNVASWSSQLGGAPTDLSPSTSTPAPTVATTQQTSTAGSPAAASKPWWKSSIATVLAILALLAAAAWFGFEIRASRRRQVWEPRPARYGAPPGWAPAASDEAIDLARQLVRLTDVVVQLVESHRSDQDVVGERARARSPDPDVPPPLPRPVPVGRRDPDESREARAGPEPPGPEHARPAPPPETPSEPARSASPTPGDSSRPGPFVPVVVERAPEPPVPEPTAEPIEALLVDESPEAVPKPLIHGAPDEAPDDPRAAMMERLLELDRERRRLRGWMDSEDSGRSYDPPVTAAEPGTDG